MAWHRRATARSRWASYAAVLARASARTAFWTSSKGLYPRVGSHRSLSRALALASPTRSSASPYARWRSSMRSAAAAGSAGGVGGGGLSGRSRRRRLAVLHHLLHLANLLALLELPSLALLGAPLRLYPRSPSPMARRPGAAFPGGGEPPRTEGGGTRQRARGGHPRPRSWDAQRVLRRGVAPPRGETKKEVVPSSSGVRRDTKHL